MKKGLTGNKDTDFKILSLLEDRELTQVCQVNKYVKSLCFGKLDCYLFLKFQN